MSPQQSHTRGVRNILHCLDEGTEMGWMIDAEERCVFVYNSDKSVQVFDQSDHLLPVPSFAKALELTVGEMFDWLKD